jgi:formate dehydrogenase major subunit
VTVYDSRPEAGGMLRYALPEYRLPKAVLDKEIELIERLGVKFQFNVNVGEDLTLNDVATSTTPSSWRSAPGKRPGSTCPAPSSRA